MTELRTGFTTGTYSAATAVAAWRCLLGDETAADAVDVLFPDGLVRAVNVNGRRRLGGMAEAWARKDAGDDVDNTDGAVIRAHVQEVAADRAAEADFVEPCGRGSLILRGGSGVGLATREGLDAPRGKWAINSIPRRMIVENLASAGIGAENGHWLVTLSIDHGEELARKTLNPKLGVVGGLSILGTSGIVIPCSNAAYIRTIEILLEGLRRTGADHVAFCTGGRTLQAAQAEYPEWPEIAFIRIGDFIREACEKAASLGFEHLTVCCMPGKLAKYALGLEYTHAHTAPLSIRDLLNLLRELGLKNEELPGECEDARSMRECRGMCSPALRRKIVSRLADCAVRNIQSWSGGATTELRVLAMDTRTWLK
ncbi:MAG: cobalt-precorrin-5B (C(1))-methyltransferase CbiD [Verrucomicrobiota bacterium]